jgi:hypothetical protein
VLNATAHKDGVQSQIIGHGDGQKLREEWVSSPLTYCDGLVGSVYIVVK